MITSNHLPSSSSSSSSSRYLERFNTPYCDVLMIHNPDPKMNANQIADDFKKAYDGGKGEEEGGGREGGGEGGEGEEERGRKGRCEMFWCCW